jgi:hypothetical protein
VNPTANIYSQITSLVRLQLLTTVGQFSLNFYRDKKKKNNLFSLSIFRSVSDRPDRYKCNVSFYFYRDKNQFVEAFYFQAWIR